MLYDLIILLSVVDRTKLRLPELQAIERLDEAVRLEKTRRMDHAHNRHSAEDFFF